MKPARPGRSHIRNVLRVAKMDPDDVLVRPGGLEDHAEIGRTAYANRQPPEDSGGDRRYLALIARHGRLLVAETPVARDRVAQGRVARGPAAGTGARLAGFAATRQVGGVTLLCDLFVDPTSHGCGIGRRLLDRIFDGTTDRVCFSSQDPRALPLYARYGLAPRWPLLYLTGDPAAVVPATAAPGVTARRVPPGDAAAAEYAFAGVDRAPDYSYWGGLQDGGGILVEQARDVIGAGATGPAELRHLAVAEGADPVATVLTALSVFGSRAVKLCLPGPHPALGPLLRSGFRIDDFDHYMSTGEGLIRSGNVLSPALA